MYTGEGYEKGGIVRTEKEISDLLSKCEKVSDFGMSKGPCLLNDRGEKGCCAECSLPNALRWILGGDDNPSYNAQDLMGEALKKL